MKINIKTITGESLEEKEILWEGGLDEQTVLSRKDVLARVIRWQLAKRRQGTHATKGISEVSGTTKKPFRQKGTGNARMGTKRAPQCRGGGIVFGPVVRNHAHRLNKKIRTLGLRIALLGKAFGGNLHCVSTPSFQKTKEFSKALEANSWRSVLWICSKEELPNIQKVAGNLHFCDVLPVDGINVYSICRRENLVLSPSVIDMISQRLKVGA